jgi:CubicO group peptidase (beta-lactamase class C family)
MFEVETRGGFDQLRTNQVNAKTDDRSNEVKFQELISITQEAMQGLHVPGVAIGLIVGAEEYSTGLGVTSIENPLPVTPTTLFQIGSTTKTITSTCIFHLVEQGKLSLDDLVCKYIPNFKVKDAEASARVTIGHLLNHTSGWMGDYFTDTGAGEDALEKYVEKMADLEQLTPLGAIYTYNNAAFNVAGRVIEVITGKAYETAVREWVLDPLEMSNSFFFPGEVMLRRFVVGHVWKENEEKLIIARPWDMGRCEAACGGLVSDVQDQLRYARFHMGNGVTSNGERLLSSESLERMQTPGVMAGGDGWIGLNWFIEDIGGVRFVSHGGSTNGQQSAFWMAPEAGLALTVMTNLDQGGELNKKVTEWVREHYLGVVEEAPSPLNLPAEQLVEYLGSYTLSPTGCLFEIKPSPAGLIMSHTLGDYSSISDTPPDPIPPVKASLYSPDRFVFIEEPLRGAKGEFLRGLDGHVAWLRFGGRVMARQT